MVIGRKRALTSHHANSMSNDSPKGKKGIQNGLRAKREILNSTKSRITVLGREESIDGRELLTLRRADQPQEA
jgi:hypothetical protein